VSQTLNVIAEEVRSCTDCRLHQGTRNGVPGEGNPQADVLLVGEGPGFHEDAQGRPFVGAAGNLLNEMLGKAGLKREDVFITNIVKHRPPGNRDPMPDEIAACSTYLERQIAEIKPVLIVTLGRHSMGYFIGPNARITQVHGSLKAWRDIAVYACFHPAAALHQPKYREMLEQDFEGLPRALAAARKRAESQASASASAGPEAGASTGDTAATNDLGGTSAPSQMTLF
jgi:uracil-DNA glycosylase family 4